MFQMLEVHTHGARYVGCMHACVWMILISTIYKSPGRLVTSEPPDGRAPHEKTSKTSMDAHLYNFKLRLKCWIQQSEEYMDLI